MPETVVHFQIRMPPHLHEELATWAKDEKASLNALVVELLQKAAGGSRIGRQDEQESGRSKHIRAGHHRRVIGIFMATHAQLDMPFHLSQASTTDMSDSVCPATSSCEVWTNTAPSD